MTTHLASMLHEAAVSSSFSGVIRIDEPHGEAFAQGYGYADRGREVPMTIDHRCGVASIAKGFTALVIGSLIDDDSLAFDSKLRAFLGDELPMIDDDVTVAHLLSHTSGIGDYLDETIGDIEDYVLTRPNHELDTTEAFLPMLDRHPQAAAPGSQFSYCNSGFILLALIAERASSTPFHDVVEQRVFAPAGMTSTGYPRTDETHENVAFGYLSVSGLRTNVLHLPVRGNGDGGAVSTAADLAAFWSALFGLRIVSEKTLSALTDPVSRVDEEKMRYGRGFWIGWESAMIVLEGYESLIHTASNSPRSQTRFTRSGM